MDPRREARLIHKQFVRYHKDIGEALIYFRFDLNVSHYDNVYDEGTRSYKRGVRVPILWVDQIESSANYTPEGRRPTQRARLSVSARSMAEAGIPIDDVHGNQITDVSPSDKWRSDRINDIFYYDNHYYAMSSMHVSGRLQGEDVIVGIGGIQVFPGDDFILDDLPGRVET